jgi:hypothetical protein
MKRISLLLALGIGFAATARAMIQGDKVEAEAVPDTARLALFDALYSRQMTAAVGRTASRYVL